MVFVKNVYKTASNVIQKPPAPNAKIPFTLTNKQACVKNVTFLAYNVNLTLTNAPNVPKAISNKKHQILIHSVVYKSATIIFSLLFISLNVSNAPP